MNSYTQEILQQLKTSQTTDVEQLAKYKALASTMDEKIRERATLIKLIEAGCNIERKNDSIASILNI